VDREASRDPAFQAEWRELLERFVGRPTPLDHARRLSGEWGGGRVYLKREDLNHTGAHKINNCLGQALLARRLGKRRIVAETGAGQHGVAAATACARLGLECVIYMGATDMRRQAVNLQRMRLLGAQIREVAAGSGTLKDAVNQALRDWVTHVRTTHYLLGSAVGPHPFPRIVRNFQAVIGGEARRQILNSEQRLPDAIVACVGGGSNAIGIFAPFLEDRDTRLVGVEAGGRGARRGEHAASLGHGSPGVLHGALSYVLQDENGQILPTHSISAGLDYPGVGPEHSHLMETGRVTYHTVTDEEAVRAYRELAETEGILPALESAHALAYARRLAGDIGPEGLLLVNLSGRGDKDLDIVLGYESGGGEGR